MALLVEALITRTPRRLWDLKTGLPARNADTLEALALCERSMAMTDKAGQRAHLAILHLHIHLMEMSKNPEQALRSADLLSTMAPDAGHMNHMPAHIYAQCGDYEKARVVSERAIRADDLYADYAGSHNFYVTARGHDLHLMMHTCMFLGQYGPALAAADKIRSIMTEDILTMKDRPKLVTMTEGYYAMKMHVLVRFGRWHEIVAEPPPGDPAIYRLTTPMHHYARGIAYATLKDPAAADRERALFRDAVARLPVDLKFLSNLARTTLGVAEAMLDGEVEYHRGNHELAFAHLREAVHRDDSLNYTEPWAWMHPPRHALAALLMEQGHYDEAEAIYRDDLGLNGRIQRSAQHPDNVWALHGLVECLQRRGETKELPGLETKLATAMARVDVPITSSCMCRTKVQLAKACCT
jgi:tetratricopeptide (TPR) repeat protein